MAYRSPYAALHGELDELLQSTREQRPYDPSMAEQQSHFYQGIEERWAQQHARFSPWGGRCEVKATPPLRIDAAPSPAPDHIDRLPAPLGAPPEGSARKEP
jgi:hypothetical protein